MSVRNHHEPLELVFHILHIKLSNQSVGLQLSKLHQGNIKLLGALLDPCLNDLSKHHLKQVPEGGYRNLNSAFFE